MCISIHALLAESDSRKTDHLLPTSNFYPRSPCGERPSTPTTVDTLICISIHALLAESDSIIKHRETPVYKFLSTLSLRRATARRASRQQPAGISIHALLAESDRETAWRCAGTPAFLSTLSLRRATPTASRRKTTDMNFYPRSPCGERQAADISERRGPSISIHALLAESDHAPNRRPCPSSNFYPRSPCGERLNSIGLIVHIGGFLSTLSLRRATPYFRRYVRSDRTFLSTLSLRRATHQS